MADISSVNAGGTEYGFKDTEARKIASTTQVGRVKPDGTTITIDNDGTISVEETLRDAEVIEGGNLCPFDPYTGTVGNVACTSKNGSVLVLNGTCNANVCIGISANGSPNDGVNSWESLCRFKLKAGSYVLFSSIPKSSLTSQHAIAISDGTNMLANYYDEGNNVFTLSQDTYVFVAVRCQSGVTYTNDEIDACIKTADEYTDDPSYAPYYEPLKYRKQDKYSNAGYHNSIYRGKYLGDSVTADQWAAISAGTFDDLFIGDYWTINSVNYRIAAFDYWLRTGDTECTTHHAVLVPDTNLYTAKMNDTNITTGGYTGSKMYTDNLASAKTTIDTAFGSAHILSHKEILVNAASSGSASGWAWFASTVELMSESMVYGHNAWAAKTSVSGLGYETGIDKGQLPLFALEPSRICNRANWWLRGVVSSTYFAYVDNGGYAFITNASNSHGVRPVFAIC